MSKESDTDNEDNEDDESDSKKTHVGITVSTSADDDDSSEDDSEETGEASKTQKEKDLDKIETPKNLSAIVEKYQPKKLPNKDAKKDKKNKNKEEKAKGKKNEKTFSSMKKPNGKPQNLEETEDIIEKGSDNGHGMLIKKSAY